MHPILATVLQRLGLGLLTLFFVSIIIFSAIEFLPGDFTEAVLGQSATEETVAAFRRELGLDQPAYVRYIDWIGSVARGDLGQSFSGRASSGIDRSRSVAELIAPRLSNTLFLAGMTAIVAVPLALILGVTAALWRGGIYDRVVNAVTLSTISMPEFLVAYLLILFLATLNPIFPSLADVTSATPFWERVTKCALPSLTLTLVIVAHMMRMTRAAIINLLASPYIEMARLKGLKPSTVILRHALPNAWAPIANVVAFNLAYLVVGVVVVEVVFVYPGVGQLMVDAVDLARYTRRAGLRADLRGHLHPLEPDGGHRVDRDEPQASAPQMTDAPETYSALDEVAQPRVRRSRLKKAWIAMKGAPVTAWFGMIVIAIYMVVALLAPLIAPYGEADSSFGAYLPWGDGHVFGTDQIGRDIFSRLIYGARNTIGIAVVTTLLAFLVGGGLGLAAAISRGWVDQVLARAIDVLMAIPSLIFALMLLSIFGSSVWSLVVIIALLDSTRVFRLTRAVAMNVAVMEYVEAARLRGEGLGWVMRREILPNIMPPLVAEFGLRFCFVFLTIASLSFLGVGIQPPTADWGSMVRENASLIQFAQYDLKAGITPLLPAGAIALLTIAVNFVVDWFLIKTSGLRDEV